MINDSFKVQQNMLHVENQRRYKYRSLVSYSAFVAHSPSVSTVFFFFFNISNEEKLKLKKHKLHKEK